MFFLAFLFLAESRTAKSLVVMLYLIWSVGAHLRHKKSPEKRNRPKSGLKTPVKEGRWPSCPKA